MSAAPPPPAIQRCPQCGTEVAASLLACPACHALVHAAELKRLADEAAAARAGGDFTATLAAWRRALELLPPDTRQHQTVTATVAELSREVDRLGGADAAKAKSTTGRGRLAKGTAGVGALALLLSKFKVVLVLLLTKGKLLLLGLTKASTVFSMALSFGVYWTVWGWKFALGLVASIYVHEMGHVAALRRFGIKATAPMFIPGIGAMVRLKQYPADPRENARIGLAGPVWGLGAAAVAFGVFRLTGAASWGAIAHVGAWINLFNLVPVWQLDGARGFHALSRHERWIAVAVIALMWFATAEGLLVLLLVCAVGVAGFGKPAEQGDTRALVEYSGLVVILSLMTRIVVPTP